MNKVNVDEIQAKLFRQVSSEKLNEVSGKFMKLETNLERVNYAHALLINSEVFPTFDTNRKSEKRSVEYRENGNLMFKEKKLEQALEFYTKSAAYATPGHDNQALAYSNRSAVLFEKGLYKECLQDITRATSGSFPSKIEEKLRNRRILAETNLRSWREIKLHEELPVLASENPHVACASDSVAINTSQEQGRHIISTKEIEIGEIIAIEKPFIAIPIPEASINHCHNCLQLSYNLIPCENCTYALFCSSACLTQSKSYHEYECPIIEILLELEISKLTQLALRVVFQAKNELGNFLFQQSRVYESEKYQEIHELCGNTALRSNADLFERALTASIIYELVDRYTNFFKAQELNSLFKEALLHQMQVAPSNFHEISELVLHETHTEPCEIGAGAYSFLSMFNHSCTPNVVRHCYGTTIVLRALGPIKKGAQLYDNYGYHYAVMSKVERQKSLRSQYYFDCQCEACSCDWPLYENLNVLNFTHEIDEDDFVKLRSGCLKTADRLVKYLLIKCAILEKNLKPSQNLAEIQECLKQCYSIFGNKKVF